MTIFTFLSLAGYYFLRSLLKDEQMPPEPPDKPIKLMSVEHAGHTFAIRYRAADQESEAARIMAKMIVGLTWSMGGEREVRYEVEAGR